MSLHEDEVLNKKKTVREGRELFADEKWRKVAVKIIMKSKKAEKEFNVLRSLKHENIVKCIAFDEISAAQDSNVYIIMELCDYTLKTYIEDRKDFAMPIQIFRSISAQLLAGLGHIHEMGLIHRDIKPDNILVTKGIKFKFSDFGIAKEFPHVTESNRDVGSDGYRSQESYNLDIKLTKMADIFSLGIVMAQLISRGEHPFGTDPNDWSFYIRKDTQLQKKDFTHVDCPTAERNVLIPLLSKMLSWDPDARPSVVDLQKHRLFSRPRGK